MEEKKNLFLLLCKTYKNDIIRSCDIQVFLESPNPVFTQDPYL